MFLAELNDLQLWGADLGNAYLKALTKVSLYIVAGTEFEELQEHVLVVSMLHELHYHLTIVAMKNCFIF